VSAIILSESNSFNLVVYLKDVDDDNNNDDGDAATAADDEDDDGGLYK
jgi:hypothetical protein